MSSPPTEQLVQIQPRTARNFRPGRKPEWLRVRLQRGAGYTELKDLVTSHGVHTVCESASCPNIGECWEQRELTLMILGGTCTRSCGFCDVHTGRPEPPDPQEPAHVAAILARLPLVHAVITSVDRDDLPDFGAAHWAETIQRAHAARAGLTIEALIPDLMGDERAQDAIFAARPDVLAHNIETVAELYPRARPKGSYQRALRLLERAAAAGLVTKSGFMVGLGETGPQIRVLLGDLKAAGVRILTAGQYLRPSGKHMPVTRYVTPEGFAEYAAQAREVGFDLIASAPLVRSSYRAHELALKALGRAAH